MRVSNIAAGLDTVWITSVSIDSKLILIDWSHIPVFYFCSFALVEARAVFFILFCANHVPTSLP